MKRASYFDVISRYGHITKRDIVDEFNLHNKEIFDFVNERCATKPYDTDEVVKKIESLVRPEYMAIIKQHQK